LQLYIAGKVGFTLKFGGVFPQKYWVY
jgi:hypothetical protein